MKKFYLLLFVLAYTGCNTVRVGELRQEFRKPGYIQAIESNNHEIVVRYVPKVMQVIGRSGLEDSARISNTIMDSVAALDSSDEVLFLLSIRPKGDSAGPGFSRDVIYGNIGGYQSYQEALSAFQFGFKERIWLESGGIRFPLANYHMENSFGMTPGRTLVLGFHGLSRIRTGKKTLLSLVLDDLVPGLSRKKLEWVLPVGKHDETI